MHSHMHSLLARRSLLLLLLALGCVSTLFLSPASAQATDLFNELRTFPGVVLLPPAELDPFTTLEPWRVELNRPRPGSTATVRGRYLVQYRDRDGGAGSAQIGGTTGREDLDLTLTALAVRSFTRCAADAPYCSENVAAQDGAPPASEVFRGLRVADSEAVVEHVVCCGGHYWSLTWYDAGRDMTYSLVLVGPLADKFGGGIQPENLDVAQRVVSLATQLVVLE